MKYTPPSPNDYLVLYDKDGELIMVIKEDHPDKDYFVLKNSVRTIKRGTNQTVKNASDKFVLFQLT